MRRRLLLLPSLTFLAAASLGLLACTVGANLGDLDAGGAESGANGSDGSAPDTAPLEAGPTTDSAPDADADAPPPLDAGCGVAFAQEGSFIDVQLQVGALPDLTGGTIVAGTYVLTAERDYLPGATGTVQVRETLVVRASSPAGAFERLTEAQKPSGSFTAIPSHGEESTWSTPSGPFLNETPECPTMAFQLSERFTADGTSLVVFDDQTYIERVYMRIR